MKAQTYAAQRLGLTRQIKGSQRIDIVRHDRPNLRMRQGIYARPMVVMMNQKASKQQVQAPSEHSTDVTVDAVEGVAQENKNLRLLGQAALVSLSVLSVSEDAFAKGGELGILEGRTLALLHPAMMFFLLGATTWSGWLGWQWRRVRTIQEEISELKAQLPAPAADGTAVISPLQTQIDSLTQERKKLVEGKYRDKHFVWGSLLLGSGITFSVEGCINTYMRTGRLFPGPHLWAGAGITACWAIAASLVPSMQKGSKVARDAHIALNAINLLLFISQVPTGLEIVGKVFQFTSWP